MKVISSMDYTLANVKERRTKFGWAPVPSEDLRIGASAKLIFESENPPRGERMWVKVTYSRRYENGKVEYRGILDNIPVVFTDCLSLGSEISFTPENVCDVAL